MSNLFRNMNISVVQVLAAEGGSQGERSSIINYNYFLLALRPY